MRQSQRTLTLLGNHLQFAAGFRVHSALLLHEAALAYGHSDMQVAKPVSRDMRGQRDATVKPVLPAEHVQAVDCDWKEDFTEEDIRSQC